MPTVACWRFSPTCAPEDRPATTATQVGAGDHHADDAGEGGGDAADQPRGSPGPRLLILRSRQALCAGPGRRCGARQTGNESSTWANGFKIKSQDGLA